jgi:bifunctional DNA-binding transcriptional regulator/antitoxin component of YhaV-PrlF toxin-antitoxin module
MHSGRIVLPADARQRNRIAKGDTVIITEDAEGHHIKTATRYFLRRRPLFAKLAPGNVSLSEEILKDRRREVERD